MPRIAAQPTSETRRVGTGFIALYTLAYMGLWLALLAPIIVTLPLKISGLVGSGKAPGALSLVAGVGAILAMLGNPLFGKLSDRTTSRFGMRRPWMLGGLVAGSCRADHCGGRPQHPRRAGRMEFDPARVQRVAGR
jgi:MFS family permease